MANVIVKKNRNSIILFVLIGSALYLFPILYLFYKYLITDVVEFNRYELIYAVYNGIKYATISTSLQITIAYYLAYTFTVFYSGELKKIRKIQQAVTDLTIFLPYLIPTAVWIYFSKWIFEDSGTLDSLIGFELRGSSVGQELELHIISLFHLFPPTYLAFRFYFSSFSKNEILYMKSIGLTFSQFLWRVNRKNTFSLLGFLFFVRFIIMFGKFDLPYYSQSQLVEDFGHTLSVYIHQKINRVGFGEELYSTVEVIIFEIILALIFILVIIKAIKQIHSLLKFKYTTKPISVLLLQWRKGKNIIRQIINFVICLFMIFMYFLLVYTILKKINFDVYPKIDLLYHIMNTLFFTLISLIIMSLIIYRIYIGSILKEGILISGLTSVIFIFYILPSPIIFSLLLNFKEYSSLNGSVYSIIFYQAAIIIYLLPLSLYFIFIMAPRINILEKIYLVNQPVSFANTYKSLFSSKMMRVWISLIITVTVIVTNELYGSIHILNEHKTISNFLYNVQDTYFAHYQMQVLWTIIFLVISNAILYALFFMVIKNGYEK